MHYNFFTKLYDGTALKHNQVLTDQLQASLELLKAKWSSRCHTLGRGKLLFFDPGKIPHSIFEA